MNLRQMLIREEGYEYKAYPDPLTHAAPWTIGVGHTGPEVHEGLEWTADQIEAAYRSDEAIAIARCNENFAPWIFNLCPARQAVLYGMAFQMGMGRLLGFKLTLAAIRDEHYEHAAVMMLDSLWARQTVGRAGRMARQIATGEWQ